MIDFPRETARMVRLHLKQRAVGGLHALKSMRRVLKEAFCRTDATRIDLRRRADDPGYRNQARRLGLGSRRPLRRRRPETRRVTDRVYTIAP
jgi:hypothetical protein